MSLIMDALEKLQQFRTKDLKGTFFFKSRPSRDKRFSSSSWRRGIIIGAAFAGLIILFVILWKPFSPVETAQIAVPIKKAKVSGPSPPPSPATKVVSESAPSASFEGQKEGPSTIQMAALPSPDTKKEIDQKDPSVEGEKTGPLLSQRVEKKEVEKLKVLPRKRAAKSLVPPPASPPSPPKRESASEPERLDTEGGTKQALERDVLTHYNSGVCFHDQREFSKAIQAYQKVIDLDPTYVEAYNNLGLVYQESGDLTRAIHAYQRVVEINPRYVKGLNNLGIALYLKGLDEEAIRTFQEVLSINANNVESYINLGVLFKKQNQGDQALESFQRALAINPSSGESHYNIALLYEQMGKVDLAIPHYQEFIRLSTKTHPNLALKVQRHLNQLKTSKGEEKK